MPDTQYLHCSKYNNIPSRPSDRYQLCTARYNGRNVYVNEMLKKRYKCLLKVGLVKTTERVYNSSSSSWQLQHSNQCSQNAVDLIQYPLSARGPKSTTTFTALASLAAVTKHLPQSTSLSATVVCYTPTRLYNLSASHQNSKFHSIRSENLLPAAGDCNCVVRRIIPAGQLKLSGYISVLGRRQLKPWR